MHTASRFVLLVCVALLFSGSALTSQDVQANTTTQYSYFSAAFEPARVSTENATTVTITVSDLVLEANPQVTLWTCADTATPGAPTRVVLSDIALLNKQTLQATVPAGLSEGIYALQITTPTDEAISVVNDFGVMRPGDGQLGPWRITTALRSPDRYAFSTVAAAGRLYIVGGDQGEPMVESAPILADGSLGAWEAQPALNTPRRNFALVSAGGYLYAIGGMHPSDFNLLTSIERAPLLNAGGIGPWEPVASLPVPRIDAAAVVVQDRLFVLGGIKPDDLHNSAFAANILPNGDLGPWEPVIPPPVREEQTMPGTIAVAAGDFVYLLGGGDTVIHRSRILADGSLEPWQEVRSSLRSHNGGGAAVIGDTLYAVGGFANCIYGSNFVERATINSDGSLGPWEPAGSTYFGHGLGSLAVWNDTLYVVGGISGFGGDVKGIEYARVGDAVPTQDLTVQIWLPQLFR